MKIIVMIATVLSLSLQTQALIKKVTIQASGLTCSMCSNAINKSLQTLDFVEKVTANIKNSTFEVTFKPIAKIDLDAIKKKVEDAGFFVAKYEVAMQLNSLTVKDDDHVEIDGRLYHFVHIGNRVLDGMVTVQVIDKGFVTDKEFKRNAKYTSMGCYTTGFKGSCCDQKTTSTLERIYHITI